MRSLRSWQYPAGVGAKHRGVKDMFFICFEKTYNGGVKGYVFFAMLTDYITDKSCARRLQGAWSSRLWRPARSAAVPRRGRCEAPGGKGYVFYMF